MAGRQLASKLCYSNEAYARQLPFDLTLREGFNLHITVNQISVDAAKIDRKPHSSHLAVLVCMRGGGIWQQGPTNMLGR